MREEGLLQGLAEAIAETEEKLLQHVRAIAARHGACRRQLLEELRALAGGMGAFQQAGAGPVLQPAETLYDVSTPTAPVMLAGDWRHAARIIEDDDSVLQALRANAR